jgi:hypothetical protein
MHDESKEHPNMENVNIVVNGKACGDVGTFHQRLPSSANIFASAFQVPDPHEKTEGAEGKTECIFGGRTRGHRYVP